MRSGKNLIKILKFLCLLTIAVTCMAQESRLTLSVVVFGAEPEKGQALFALFDSRNKFLKIPVISKEAPIDDTGGTRFVVPGLAAGIYAVSVVHDEDSNGELNTGFLGIPNERVGFSNNPRNRFGPPSFNKARFDLNTSRTIEIFLDSVE